MSRLAHSFCLECQLLVLIHYVTDEIFSEWQNHTFLWNKYVSKALFQTWQATEMNFEKLLAWQGFKNHNGNPFQSSSS